jgi:hypothetical protein
MVRLSAACELEDTLATSDFNLGLGFLAPAPRHVIIHFSVDLIDSAFDVAQPFCGKCDLLVLSGEIVAFALDRVCPPTVPAPFALSEIPIEEPIFTFMS